MRLWRHPSSDWVVLHPEDSELWLHIHIKSITKGKVEATWHQGLWKVFSTFWIHLTWLLMDKLTPTINKKRQRCLGEVKYRLIFVLRSVEQYWALGPLCASCTMVAPASCRCALIVPCLATRYIPHLLLWSFSDSEMWGTAGACLVPSIACLELQASYCLPWSECLCSPFVMLKNESPKWWY